MYKCIETSQVVATCIIFMYRFKSQIKIYLSVAVEFIEKITYPREYVSIYVLQREAVFKLLCCLRINLMLKSNEDKQN